MFKDISKIVFFCGLLIVIDMEVGLLLFLYLDFLYNCNCVFFSIKYYFVKKYVKYFG